MHDPTGDYRTRWGCDKNNERMKLFFENIQKEREITKKKCLLFFFSSFRSLVLDEKFSIYHCIYLFIVRRKGSLPGPRILIFVVFQAPYLARFMESHQLFLAIR